MLIGKCFVFSVINIAEGEENSTPQPRLLRAPSAQNQYSSIRPFSPDDFDENYEDPAYQSEEEEHIGTPVGSEHGEDDDSNDGLRDASAENSETDAEGSEEEN